MLLHLIELLVYTAYAMAMWKHSC